MAQNTTIAIGKTWTLLTDSNVASITFQNNRGVYIEIYVTADTVAPTVSDGILYAQGYGERNVLLTHLAPGVTSPARVWAKTDLPDGAVVFVSHA
jgi:hypothetical protein